MDVMLSNPKDAGEQEGDSNTMEELPGSLEKQSVKRTKRRRIVTRRGKRNNVCTNMTNFVLLHSNIRGLKSKIQSLNYVANNIVMPDCISLTKHGIHGNNKVKVENYQTFNTNHTNKRMGGVSL